MILISSISSGPFFHLPNKPGWDFQKCLKCFSPTYLWLLLKMFSKSRGISSISVHFCFMHTWFNSCSESQSWPVNPVAFIIQDQRLYIKAKTPGLIWRWVCNTHSQTWLFISLFEGLLQPSLVTFSAEALEWAFLCVFYLRTWETSSMYKYQSKQKFLSCPKGKVNQIWWSASKSNI